MNTMLVMEEAASDKWHTVLNTVINWCMTVGKNILIAILILFVASKLLKWVIKLIGNSFKKTKMDPMVAKFVLSLIKFILYFVVAITVISVLGIPTTSLIAALGTVGLTIGLALQGSLSNFAGGVLILLFKPFKIGDYIKEDVHGNEGTVVGIDLFYTKVLTVDNKTIVVPNGSLANTSLTNYTAQEKRRVDITVGISYDSDIKLAKDIIQQVPDGQDKILKDEGTSVYVDSLGDSSIVIGTRAWVKTEDYWTVRWALLEEYKAALDENGISIPYNQLEVTVKSNEK